MKKWIIIGIVVLGIAAVVFLELKWQTISMLLAGLAAPFKLLAGFFGNKEEEIRKRHAETREREAGFQRVLETNVQGRESRVLELEDRISQLDAQLADLETQRSRVKQDVDSMSLEELQLTGSRYFGS